MRKFWKVNFCIAIYLILVSAGIAANAEDGRTDSMAFFVDPDPSAGQTYDDFWKAKQYIYNYREVTVHKGMNSSYFMITGANVTSVEYYGGVQQIYDGRHAVIFSVWDARLKCGNVDCYPEATDTANQAKLINGSQNAVTKRFDNEGNGLSTLVYDANWQYGQKIGWLVNQEPADKGTIISAAYRLGEGPWNYIVTYYIPKRYDIALMGGYGFIEDYAFQNSPTIERSMTVGSTILEDENGNQDVMTNVYIGSNADKKRHKVEVIGDSLKLSVGIEPQPDAKGDYRVRLGKPNAITDYSGGKLVIQQAIKGISTLPQEKALRDKAKLEAKAAAELKAKQEAEAKAAATLKAKTYTITCIKGKIIKKITAISPKCPSGYKRK